MKRSIIDDVFTKNINGLSIKDNKYLSNDSLDFNIKTLYLKAVRETLLLDKMKNNITKEEYKQACITLKDYEIKFLT